MNLTVAILHLGSKMSRVPRPSKPARLAASGAALWSCCGIFGPQAPLSAVSPRSTAWRLLHRFMSASARTVTLLITACPPWPKNLVSGLKLTGAACGQRSMLWSIAPLASFRQLLLLRSRRTLQWGTSGALREGAIWWHGAAFGSVSTGKEGTVIHGYCWLPSSQGYGNLRTAGC